MTITPSKLRENLYNILDTVIETKEPLEVKRNGQILMIVPEHKKSRLKAIQPKKSLRAVMMNLSIHLGRVNGNPLFRHPYRRMASTKRAGEIF
jgi:PHD/YefM family antitoxin component YafN of YafNO toxin-antitoxin module